VVRAADPDGMALVGTRGFSSLGLTDGADETEIIEDPVDAENIMYTFHFYAASHGADRRTVVDHRVCDGGVAGGFLRFVADCVERPQRLLLHL
jgi:pyruvate/2-oxoglutarate dehydrogenase complex dihydrolipoamide acyltransferase (E2) component